LEKRREGKGGKGKREGGRRRVGDWTLAAA